MSQDSRNRAWQYLEDRFGIELEDHELKQVSGDFWLVSGDLETGYEVETYGVRCVRDTGNHLKPTTYALQLLGDRLERNVVEIDREELETLLDREMVARDAEEEGYVALKYDGRVIGCGLYKDEKVSTRIPKSRSKELRQILAD